MLDYLGARPLLDRDMRLGTVDTREALDATRDGIARIADAQALDVISLGIDQDAQANFFHPERQDARRTGAGGVHHLGPAGGAEVRGGRSFGFIVRRKAHGLLRRKRQ